MTTDFEAKSYKASDVRELANISYRQLNDWEAKGVFPPKRMKVDGWRRFDIDEVFALMICSEIRNTFGVPVETLGSLYSFITNGEDAYLRKWVDECLDKPDQQLFLLADLKEFLTIGTFEDFAGRFNMSPAQDMANGYLLLRLNPLAVRWRDSMATQKNMKLSSCKALIPKPSRCYNSTSKNAADEEPSGSSKRGPRDALSQKMSRDPRQRP